MRVVLPVRGSDGDFRPVLALGHALQARGHQVIVVSHGNVAAQAAGLQFQALDDDLTSAAFARDVGLLQDAQGGVEFWRRHVIPRLLHDTRVLLDLRPDLLLLQPVYDVAGRLVAELADVSLCWASISPAMYAGLPTRIGLMQELAPDLNAIRRTLGLDAVTDFAAWMDYGTEAIGLWPDWFAPDLAGPGLVPVGFVPVETGANTRASRVLVTGSTGRFLPGTIFEVAVAACARLQQPALVLSRFPDLVPAELPAGVEMAGFHPHEHVMPTATVVIHHGGIGTALSALAHGRPQVVLAAGVDRPDTGSRLERIGVGRSLPVNRWTPSQVACALHDVLTSPAIRERCDYYQNVLSQPRTLEGAVAVVERAAGRPWRPPPQATQVLVSTERRALAARLLEQRRRGSGPGLASAAQQRLWFLQQVDPASSAFHKIHGLRLSGRLEVGRLDAALEALLVRHPVLRTGLRWQDDALHEIPGGGAAEWLRVDLRTVPAAEHSDRVQRIAYELAAPPYDVEHGPWVRPALLQLAETEHVLLVGLHALVSDAASTMIMWSDLGESYGPRPSPEPLHYGAWARGREGRPELAESLEWWRTTLRDVVETEPPRARARPLQRRPGAASHVTTLSVPLSRALANLAREQDVSLFVVLLAVWKMVLLRHQDATDVVVGTRAANRLHPAALRLMGPLANTLVLRTRVGGDPTFIELLHRVAATWAGAASHQEVPFQRVVEVCQSVRRPNRQPFFSVLFYLHGELPQRVPWGDLEARPFLLKRGGTTDDLVLACRPVAGELRCLFEYRTDRYDADSIADLAAEWSAALDAVVAGPHRRVSEVAPRHAYRTLLGAEPRLTEPSAPTEFEVELAGLFAQVLGRSEVGRYDNFFSLGGHSMLAVRLVAAIERQMGRALPLSTFFEGPTPADLARALETEPAPGALVTLQPGQGGGTLFVVHPLSGRLNIYRAMVGLLGTSPTVHGLQALLQDGVFRHRDMAAMADHYAAEIQRVLPHGPYLLAGLSLGARIALQVAVRLPATAGNLVILLDGWGPGYPRFPALPARLAIHLRRASQLPPSERVDYLRLRVGAVRELLGARYRRLVQRARPSAEFAGHLSPGLIGEPPPVYAGQVVLLRAREQPTGCFPDPRLGWTEDLLPHLEVVEVPGYHGHIMHEPHVQRVAEVIRARLAVTPENHQRS